MEHQFENRLVLPAIFSVALVTAALVIIFLYSFLDYESSSLIVPVGSALIGVLIGVAASRVISVLIEAIFKRIQKLLEVD